MDTVTQLRLLIVDDDPDLRANLREVLEGDGYRIDEAGSVGEALDRRNWSEYLAVMIDIRLPDGSGQDLIPRLKALSPQAAPIVLTGHSDVRGAIAAFRDGAIDYLLKPIDVGVVRNHIERVAEQRRIEEALSESQERLRLISECGLIGIASFTVGGRVTDANDAFLRLVGYSREELASGQVCWDRLTPQEWWPRMREADAELETAGRVRPYIKEYFHRDGRRLWGLFGGAQLSGRRGGVAFVVDMTELRHAQERALRAERLAAIGSAMTGLIHESRNAMQRSHACLEMLVQHVGDRPKALDLIARIREAEDHLARLYEDVRSYVAPIRMDCLKCDLAAVWRGAWAELQPARARSMPTLREQVSSPDLRCLVDPRLMGHVFRNLLENALAACHDPVEVMIRAEPFTLEGRPAVRLAIRDNGPGLDPEQREKAFDPFYTTKTKGTGLGLAIARRIVEAHGGRIAVGESLSLGAEFVITIPVAGLPH
jgi:PAS domain S-box-containing protein